MSLNTVKWISAAFLTPLLCAADLSSYRTFQLGMDLSAAEKQGGPAAPEVKTIHSRPALIQDLEWRPRGSAGIDPLKDVLLSFYNGKLFRIVANYDRYRTEGMTAEDMIEAISTTYGPAARPAAVILFPSVMSENVKVIARWEDSEYSLNLVQSPYQPSFALVSFSKQLGGTAQTAGAEAIRLDAQEAPQRDAEQKRRQADQASATQEKARMTNKPGFRP
jgi:hypothetical protein